MSLWGKSESLLAGSGTVVINLSTKAVTGTHRTFLDTMGGKVITVGAAGTCGEAVIASKIVSDAIDKIPDDAELGEKLIDLCLLILKKAVKLTKTDMDDKLLAQVETAIKAR